MKGLTNAISQSGGGGGGDTISAVNRTNAVIREGDKVWVNKNSVVPNSKYTWDTPKYYSSYVAISDSTCQVGAYGSNKCYSLKDTSAELIETQATSVGKQVIYTEDGTVLYGASGNANGMYTLTLESLVTKVNNNRSYIIFPNLYGSYKTSVSLWDIKNGVASKTWSYDSLRATYFVYNGYVYGIDEYTMNNITLKLNEDGTMTNMSYRHALDDNVIGYTSDLKYIFIGDADTLDLARRTVYRAAPNGDMLKFTRLQDGDLPTKLLTMINSCSMTFNPVSNILSVANETEYLFYKYENEELVELAIDLGIGDLLADGYTITNCPFINSDLSRAVIGLNKDDVFYPYTCLIQKTSDYNLVAYKSYMITADTLTGKANQDIPSGGTGEVTTILAD